MINASRLSEPLNRDSVENLPSEQQLSELQLLNTPLRPRLEPSLEEWLALPIRTPKGQRPVLFASDSEKAAAHCRVRRDHALGVIYEHTENKPRRGDLLSHKLGNRFYRLQKQLIATEGTPSAVLQQEARDAYRASATPAQEESPEIRAYLERIWGALKYPSVSEVPWTPFAEKRINLSELFPEPR
ncbi:hypothetical protein [Prochlorococcus sp. MIT 1303]|uniref:hypothetical protein n=1 Tax=Prochlorococcus sp. MIT 1303 TaxID=1723647 RepID=UPI0007B397EE|nr:hypothetical protein [Prochlorococcus sp. MIT 1303]KZR64552.1 hypothetical protein PMIT1303_01597 [Prochlorococcus sp. MIT 1303]